MGTLLDQYKAGLTGKTTAPVKPTTAKTGSLLAEYKKKLLEKSTPTVQPKQTVKVGQLTQQPKVSVAKSTTQPKISVAQPIIQPKVSVALTAEQKQAQALKNIAQSPTAKPQDIIGLGLGPISQKKTEDIKQLIHQQTISQGQKPKETDIKKTIKEVEDARLNYLRKKQKTEVFKKEGVSGQETGPTDKNAIKEFSDALVRSYYSMIKPSIGTLAETAAISPKMKKWGQEFSDKAEAQLLKNPQLLPSQSKNWSNQVANILGEMIPFMATVVGASFVVGPIAGLSTGAMLEKSSAYRNYINQGIPPDKADVISSAYGLVASGIENVFGIRPAIIGGKVMSATTKKIFVKSFLDYVKKELPKIGIKTLKTAIEEGGEEAIQGIAEQIGLKYFDENANIFENMAENFIGGAVGGAFLGGGGALAKSAVSTQFQKPQIEDIRKQIVAKVEEKEAEQQITPTQKPKTAITEAIAPEVGKVATPEIKAPETTLEVRDKTGLKLQDPYTAEYLPTNPDGTITLYHSTTKEGAEKIKQSGIFGSKTEGGDIYFTTNKKGYGGIGKDKDVVLAFNVDPKKIKFDDVYRGELHLKGNNTDIGGLKPVEIKTKSQLIAKTIKEISQGLEKQKEVAELSKLKQRKSQLEKEIVSTPQKRKTALEKPVKYGTGKIRESKTFKRLTQELKDSGIEEYKAIELAENRVRAIEFVKDNPELSERIAKGLETPPEGITLATLTDEVFKKLNNEGRGKEAIKLAKKQANRAIRSGQEIVSLKEIYNQNSTQRYVNELLKERARKKLNIKYEKGKPTANKVIRTRAEAINRQINKKASKIKSAQEIINSIIC